MLDRRPRLHEQTSLVAEAVVADCVARYVRQRNQRAGAPPRLSFTILRVEAAVARSTGQTLRRSVGLSPHLRARSPARSATANAEQRGAPWGCKAMTHAGSTVAEAHALAATRAHSSTTMPQQYRAGQAQSLRLVPRELLTARLAPIRRHHILAAGVLRAFAPRDEHSVLTRGRRRFVAECAAADIVAASPVQPLHGAPPLARCSSAPIVAPDDALPARNRPPNR